MTNTRPRIEDWCRCGDGRWHPWILLECPGSQGEERGDVIPVTPFLTAALDQLYAFRRLMAVAASDLEAALDARMTQKRRNGLRALVQQLRKTARGNAQGPLLGQDVSRAREMLALDRAGWDGNLTRSRWESETFGTGLADRVTW